MHELFISKAPKIVANLMHDLSLTSNQASGILGNIGRECGGFLALQEVRPVSGVGGLGWDQWTGPRRKTFEAFCKALGVSTSSDAGNYAYLVHELKTTEASSLRALRLNHSLYDCTASFEEHYERAGVPAIADRVVWAEMALKAYQASTPTNQRGVAPVAKSSNMFSLKGWRTRIVSAAIFIVGVADLLHDVNVGSALSLVGIPADKVGGVMVILSVLMAFMREITNTEAGVQTPSAP